MINTSHAIGIVAVASLVTMAIRAFPFIVFPENKELPNFLVYLSRVLPSAIMGMLIVYCFRNTDIQAGAHGLPELIATSIVVGSYLWKKNILISIAVGTVCYMIMVQWGI